MHFPVLDAKPPRPTPRVIFAAVVSLCFSISILVFSSQLLCSAPPPPTYIVQSPALVHTPVRGPGTHKYAPFSYTPPLTIADGLDVTVLANAWKDCSGGIYLDVGSNVGVQVRKLYNAQQFPEAEILPIFDKHFGHDRSRVCAVGFEPNPNHAQYLQSVNQWFGQKGHQAVILTHVAVAAHRGNAMFHRNTAADEKNHEWGASLGDVNAEDREGVNTALLDLAEFFWHVVHPIVQQEKIKHPQRIAPPVLMKLDIEGAEFSVVPRLMLSGALCQIDRAFIEWHNGFRTRMPEKVKYKARDLTGMFAELRSVDPHCKVVFGDVDDETYRDGPQYPLE